MHSALTFFKDKGNRFLLQMAAVYLSWKCIYYLIENDKRQLHTWWTQLIQKLGAAYAEVTLVILKFMGESAIRVGSEIQYPAMQRVIQVEEHCLAIPAMYIYTMCILVFRGQWKNKLWFIPLGLLGIACINIGRLVVLSFVFAHLPEEYFIFHHSFLFIVFTYSLVLLLIRIWMKYFSEVS